MPAKSIAKAVAKKAAAGKGSGGGYGNCGDGTYGGVKGFQLGNICAKGSIGSLSPATKAHFHAAVDKATTHAAAVKAAQAAVKAPNAASSGAGPAATVAAPKAAPKAAPTAAPKAAPVVAPKAAAKATAQVTPKAAPKAAPKATPKATPKAGADKAAVAKVKADAAKAKAQAQADAAAAKAKAQADAAKAKADAAKAKADAAKAKADAKAEAAKAKAQAKADAAKAKAEAKASKPAPAVAKAQAATTEAPVDYHDLSQNPYWQQMAGISPTPKVAPAPTLAAAKPPAHAPVPPLPAAKGQQAAKPVAAADTHQTASPSGWKPAPADQFKSLGTDQHALNAWGDAAGYTKWGKSLTPAQKSEIEDYTLNGYTDTNHYLRTGQLPHWMDSPVGKANMDKSVAELKSMISQPKLPEPITVYRGIPDLKAMTGGRSADQLKMGDVLSDKAFLSTTIKTGGIGFEKSGGAKGASFQIRLPKGTPGAFVEKVSSASGEYEFLMPPGARMRVVSVAKAPNGQAHIVAELIPYGS